jgi:sporulation protein YlmC with PRC-barrel domain
MRRAIATMILVLAVGNVASAQEPVPQSGNQLQSAEPPSAQAPIIGGIPSANQTDARPASAAGIISEQMEGELLSSDLIGRPLHDRAGARLGTVRDILIDRNHRMTALIADLDDGAGSGGRRVGIPIDAIEQTAVSRRETRLLVKIDPAALRNAKAFEPLAREASLDDNQDLTTGSGAATGGSVPPTR